MAVDEYLLLDRKADCYEQYPGLKPTHDISINRVAIELSGRSHASSHGQVPWLTPDNDPTKRLL